MASCTPAPQWSGHAQGLTKLTFDLTELDEQGLCGQADGLRALSYEFCIPARPVLAEQVRKIDPSIVIFDQAPGRSQCGSDTFLCIGSTYQPGFRDILLRLSALSYVESIHEAVFE